MMSDYNETRIFRSPVPEPQLPECRVSSLQKLVRHAIAERRRQRLTQREVAERAGMKQSNVSRFESGKYNPTVAFLQRIAAALGKELDIDFK